MHTWDLCGRDPDQIIDRLTGHGLNACSLALSYHGGRMLLAANPDRVVYEQHPGALYFRAETGRFPDALRPAVATGSDAAERFLARCAQRGFPVEAWLVLCHQDALAGAAPQTAVKNAFGETYSHALCPANQTVQEFCAELCRQAACVPGVTGLDLEALSFPGYEHGGMHDKRGIPMSKDLAWWLSICCCDDCRKALPGVDAEIRARVRQRLADAYTTQAITLEAEAEILAWRRSTQLALLRRVREAAPNVPLNLRVSPDPHFSAGKSTLTLPDIAGIAEQATFTYFGAAVGAMADGLAAMPRQQNVSVNAGFVFHEPDCKAFDDVRARVDLVTRPGAAGISAYCFGMASQPHWNWLKQAILERNHER